MELAITKCAECPFTERDHVGLPMCNAEATVNWSRDVRHIVVDGIDPWLFPPRPPDWCPLRTGPIAIRLVRERREGDED